MARYQIINILIAICIQFLLTACLAQAESQKFHRNSCHREATFKANGRNFIVKASSSKLISILNMPSLSHCARSCIKENYCKSMVYKKKPTMPNEKNCQLLNAEKSSLTSNDKESSTGWIHYEPLKQKSSRCRSGYCQPGYECLDNCDSSKANNYKCNDIDECASNPCQNGGTCYNEVNSYSCICHRNYTGTSCEREYGIIITSLNYPKNYVDYLTQEWIASVACGRVTLYFYEFDLEEEHDKVELRDGGSRTASLIGEFSGSKNQKHKTHTANGDTMFIRFTTDRSKVFRGFKARIRSDDCKAGECTVQNTTTINKP